MAPAEESRGAAIACPPFCPDLLASADVVPLAAAGGSFVPATVQVGCKTWAPKSYVDLSPLATLSSTPRRRLRPAAASWQRSRRRSSPSRAPASIMRSLAPTRAFTRTRRAARVPMHQTPHQRAARSEAVAPASAAPSVRFCLENKRRGPMAMGCIPPCPPFQLQARSALAAPALGRFRATSPPRR